MVRIMIKGGVWKNTEDEIMKAAVMKYGKNQWSRVSSLLNRKSAKQCKARWYEWLDPSIKKVEWTREEEEKLLHLAKIYPSQWRTIAPIVGRTAAQCMEHYEHLLDVAQASAAGEDSVGVSAEESRKLKPGEIDPHPETKPARPDPIDMDEDEKEMLAEARARLANTRGKKAKRKAREKQLEEAKRVSNMQKRRELKAAGVEKKAGQRKRKYVDYRTEIPFQRLVPNGFFDVGEERDQTKQLSIESAGRDFEVQRLDQMENKRRNKEEAEEKKKDRRKMKKIEESNPAAIMEQLSKANDPLNYRARTELSLPAPQVSDVELEQVLKIGEQAMIASEMANASSGSSTTRGLVGDYSASSALPTPMRTPRVQQGKDVILQESLNQLAMMQTKTPLLGGENPTLQEGTGFGGITPRSTALTTPNVMGGMTPIGGMTPMGGASTRTDRSMAGGGTPMSSAGGGTPLRDELGVNKSTEWTPVISGMSESSRAKHQKMQLSSSLAGLPEPQYTYEVEVPQVKGEEGQDDKGKGSAGNVEDAADVDFRNETIMKEAEAAEFARRHAAVRKELPRPNISDEDKELWVNKKYSTSDGMDASDQLIRSEMANMLAYDAIRFPFIKSSVEQSDKKAKSESKKRRRGGNVNLEEFSDGALLQAKSLIAYELNQDEVAMRNQIHNDESLSVFNKLWMETHGSIAYLPARSEYAPMSSSKDKIAALSFQFEAVRGHMAKHAEKCAKMERKLQVKTKGYEEKAQSVRNATNQAFSTYDKRSIELQCFELLAKNEARAIPQRMNELYDLSKVESDRNAELQQEYMKLLSQRDMLYNKLATHKLSTGEEAPSIEKGIKA